MGVAVKMKRTPWRDLLSPEVLSLRREWTVNLMDNVQTQFIYSRSTPNPILNDAAKQIPLASNAIHLLFPSLPS
jgi:hypothetical protein